MKRIFIFFLLFLLVGCNTSNSFRPNIKQIIDELEVNSTYDAMELIRNVSDDHYTITVVNDEIDTTILGNHNITYEISNDRGESKEMTFLVSVVDTTAPQIHIITDIMAVVNESLDISKFVQVVDNYDLYLNDKLVIDGEYDLHKAGEYRVHLSVTDSSNNTATKTVTIYVVDDGTVDSGNDLLGTYVVNYADDDIYNPTLILCEEDTFVLTINYCSGIRTFNGTYTVNGNMITLTSDTFTFNDDDPSSSSATIIINDDQSLTYMNDYPACSPLRNDVFIKK